MDIDCDRPPRECPFLELESQVHEARNAATVLTRLFEATIAQPGNVAGLRQYLLTEDDYDGLSFAVHQIGRLTRRLSEDYGRAYEAELRSAA